jgi:hypothetical protein
MRRNSHPRATQGPATTRCPADGTAPGPARRPSSPGMAVAIRLRRGPTGRLVEHVGRDLTGTARRSELAAVSCDRRCTTLLLPSPLAEHVTSVTARASAHANRFGNRGQRPLSGRARRSSSAHPAPRIEAPHGTTTSGRPALSAGDEGQRARHGPDRRCRQARRSGTELPRLTGAHLRRTGYRRGLTIARCPTSSHPASTGSGYSMSKAIRSSR